MELRTLCNGIAIDIGRDGIANTLAEQLTGNIKARELVAPMMFAARAADIGNNLYRDVHVFASLYWDELEASYKAACV